jgi:hypothetical protein
MTSPILLLVRVSLDARVSQGFKFREFERVVLAQKSQRCIVRLVPWVNGVKWRKDNGLERLRPKERKVRFNGAAMEGPPNQNPKGRRLISV